MGDPQSKMKLGIKMEEGGVSAPGFVYKVPVVIPSKCFAPSFLETKEVGVRGTYAWYM